LFLSKIWFFVIAVVAAVAVLIALIMPRPAERVQTHDVEPDRVTVARASVEMLLRENARSWIDLASVFARVPAPQGQPSLKLDAVLEQASGQETIAQPAHETARSTLQYIMSQVSGAQKPEFAIALDDTGRVVARVGIDEKSWGDDISGYFLVRDALRGYLRDDLWFLSGKLYRVAAAPVIARANFSGREGQSDRYVGAIVLGDEVDLPLAKALEERIGRCPQENDGSKHCEPHVAFFVKDETVAASDTSAFGKDIYEGYLAAKAAVPAGEEFKPPQPFEVKGGDKTYLVAVRQLPGEVGSQDGYYAVFSPRSKALGFAGTLNNVKKEDIGWKEFHWVTLVLLFLLATGGGLALMWWESDKPLRGLMIDAVALGKGEAAKLDEDKHRGRFGSIARSVNIALEKLTREARASRKDLGAVLGPAPDDGLLSGGGRSMPSLGGGLGGGSPFAAPPPAADFSFDAPPQNPVPSAPLHLSPSSPAAPSGRGFDFDMPPVPSAPTASVASSQRIPVAPATPPPRPNLPPLPSAGAPPRPPTRASQPAMPPARAAAPPPPPSIPQGSPAPRLPTASIPVVRPAVPAVPSLDDDILAPNLDDDMVDAPSAGGRGDFGGQTVVADPSEDLLRMAADGGDASYFREVFDDFVELKRKCGESIDNLTYEKFSAKLRANRDALIAKYHCKAVKFQVYVKDGKAALKATPVKS
jgi:hypothetical protein